MLERGSIRFLYRPRVETWEPEGLEDVQRLLMVMAPQSGRLFRVIAVGRKRLPRPARRERFWGFVDLVLHSSQDLRAALDAQTYGTNTRGVRHLPAAREAGHGLYELHWHEGHAHLRYELRHIASDDPVVPELDLEPTGTYIVTLANPDPTAWELLESPPLQYELFDEAEIHVTVPTPFPAGIQSRFEGRRYLQLEETAPLDYPGAELVFIAR